MRREVMNTTHGGAPGKPEWRQEIAQKVENTKTEITDDAVEMQFGYEPAGKADKVRAMIVESGSGSAVGRAAIHAGPTGRVVWNSELDGRHKSKAKSVYDLPAAFNQTGNQFVENAMRMMQTEFGLLTELSFATMPDSAFYGNVVVEKQ